MWYLYQHINKINNKSYIGKTENIEKRWANNGKNYQTCPRFWSAIVSYGWDNFEHKILLTCESVEEINLKEKEYILKYNTSDPNFGYNLAEGGTGGNVWFGKTEEQKKIYAEQRREETLSRGEEWHNKLSEGQLKRWSSEEGQKFKEKQHIRMLGENNPGAKKCKCVELNKIFNSYADACDYLNQQRSYSGKIGEVIRGKRKTFAGYHWEAVNDSTI